MPNGRCRVGLEKGRVFISNRTFLVRFSVISHEFGQAVVRILESHCRAKMSMARPNEPGMPSKRTIRFESFRHVARSSLV